MFTLSITIKHGFGKLTELWYYGDTVLLAEGGVMNQEDSSSGFLQGLDPAEFLEPLLRDPRTTKTDILALQLWGEYVSAHLKGINRCTALLMCLVANDPDFKTSILTARLPLAVEEAKKRLGCKGDDAKVLVQLYREAQGASKNASPITLSKAS